MFFIYYIIVNLCGLTIMYIDKRKAQRGKWRISEAKLFTTAAVFGSLGVMLGMKIFRHKTKHLKFMYGIPAMFLIQVYLIYKFNLMNY
ncbi:DUF1294 domain-containing protein [Clostridium sp. ZS2-4]|nr:DUF1294 domain-containing protein [Clostridium sp. ZS2-4]MCY6356127.1 DUF1294 domain-containing protein [Clostridium sp. ZS2-4]